MELHRLFSEHPQSVGETYGEHMVRATNFGGRMVVAGLACMVHAVLPFVFVRTGSQAIEELNAEMLAVKRAAALRANTAVSGELSGSPRLPT